MPKGEGYAYGGALMGAISNFLEKMQGQRRQDELTMANLLGQKGMFGLETKRRREEQAAGQAFQAGEAGKGRAFRAGEAVKGREFAAGETEKDRQLRRDLAQKDRNLRLQLSQGTGDEGKLLFDLYTNDLARYSTAQKRHDDLIDQRAAINEKIAKLEGSELDDEQKDRLLSEYRGELGVLSANEQSVADEMAAIEGSLSYNPYGVPFIGSLFDIRERRAEEEARAKEQEQVLAAPPQQGEGLKGLVKGIGEAYMMTPEILLEVLRMLGSGRSPMGL